MNALINTPINSTLGVLHMTPSLVSILGMALAVSLVMARYLKGLLQGMVYAPLVVCYYWSMLLLVLLPVLNRAP